MPGEAVFFKLIVSYPDSKKPVKVSWILICPCSVAPAINS